jgi:tetratricopeptide (TPR) repeat protein
LMILPGELTEVKKLGWSPDGACLAALDNLGKVHYWSAAPGYAAVASGLDRQAEARFKFDRALGFAEQAEFDRAEAEFREAERRPGGQALREWYASRLERIKSRPELKRLEPEWEEPLSAKTNFYAQRSIEGASFSDTHSNRDWMNAVELDPRSESGWLQKHFLNRAAALHQHQRWEQLDALYQQAEATEDPWLWNLAALVQRLADQRLVEVERERTAVEEFRGPLLNGVDWLLAQVDRMGRPGSRVDKQGAADERHAAARKVQADALLTEAIQICRQLAAELRNEVTSREGVAERDLSKCYHALAGALDRVGRAPEAIDAMQQSMQWIQSALDSYPTETNRVTFAEQCYTSGDLLLRSGRTKEALAYFRQAFPVLTQLLHDNPLESSNYRKLVRNQSVTLIKAYQKLGNTDEVRQYLAELDPHTAGDYVLRAFLYETLGDANAALADYEQALEIDARDATSLNGFERAQILYRLAQSSRDTPVKGDDLFRRAVAEYRNYLSGDEKPVGQRAVYAANLRRIAFRGDFSRREPDEAEKLLDESIDLWREIYEPLSSPRHICYDFMLTLVAQARHQRRIAAAPATDGNIARVAGRATKAEALFREAINVERQSVLRFALPADRNELAKILQEEAEHLLGRVDQQGAA